MVITCIFPKIAWVIQKAIPIETKIERIDQINYNIRMMKEMEENSTPEAQYVNELLK
ncbi:MAG: hypothetical protein KBT11_07980 [Treponema sp.]|nr:hypothetical protein [Candidatus Treponema equifaecale]